MPLQATSGAASYDAFGGGVAAVPNYIEDVFQTWLYQGNGTTQTITNGIDLSTKGGLVWAKDRDAANAHTLYDTVRGVRKTLYSNTTGTQVTEATNEGVYAFGTTGFSIGGGSNTSNGSGNKIASWTFRKQPKFFDVVTYTGNGANRSIAHNLGSAPGCIIIKCTSTAKQWTIWHRAGTQLNNFCAYFTTGGYIDQGTSTWGTNGGVPSMTSTTFSLGFDGEVNQSGATYVAYLFAHNAGGFGLTGTDNVISCGSYTGTGAVGNKITLGYEPQWLLIKRTDTANSWYLFDTMRGLSLTQSLALLPNGTNSDLDYGSSFQLNADGVTQNNANSAFNASGGTYIYIAIRRGPMKVPTDGTKVLTLSTWTGSTGNKDLGSQTANFGTGFATFIKGRDYGQDWGQFDQLRGVRPFLSSDLTSAEINDGASTGGISVVSGGQLQLNSGSYFGGGGDGTGFNYIGYNFRRAPSFFDEVCYTGDGSSYQIVQHNLGVLAELAIVKRRSSTAAWAVGILGGYNLLLNTTAATTSAPTNGMVIPNWNVNQIALNDGSGSTSNNVNASGSTYVAYLFATCPGVSKVGSYTGTGTTKQVDCGFTGGARFVLIKRTDSTGSWYVWDVARGISSGNDPYLLLNSTAAEVTNTDYIDAYSAGFEISSTAPAEINASGGSFIFLAIS